MLINSKKDCHQDNLSFAYLQFYMLNCLNKLAGNVCFHKRVKNQPKQLKMVQILHHLLTKLNHVKRHKLYQHMFFFWFLYIYHH